ncbi:hypothetical protein MKZ02_00180 [Pseudobacillus sp. FSL P4-0506]|uniref:hypothetical protein n=1 Tax=unclassified Pseudobacillus TaxID=2619284 RepID=UPI0030F80B88
MFSDMLKPDLPFEMRFFHFPSSKEAIMELINEWFIQKVVPIKNNPVQFITWPG